MLDVISNPDGGELVDGTTDRQKENKKLLAIFEQDCKTIVEQDHLEQVFKEFETSKLCGLLDVQQAAFQISDGSTWQKWQASCDELAIFHHMLYDILKMSRDTHGAIEKDIILNEKFPMLATWLKIPWRAQENPHESKEWVESATLKYCKSPQFESPEGSKTFTPRLWGKYGAQCTVLFPGTTTVLTIATPEKQPWNSKYQDLGVHVTCCGKASHIFYTEKLFCLHVCSECPRRVLAPSPGLVVSMLTEPLCFGHIEFLPFAMISLRDESLPPLTAAPTPAIAAAPTPIPSGESVLGPAATPAATTTTTAPTKKTVGKRLNRQLAIDMQTKAATPAKGLSKALVTADKIPEHYTDTMKWKLLRQLHTADCNPNSNSGKIKKGDKYVEYQYKSDPSIVCQVEVILKDMRAVSNRLRTQKQSKKETVKRQLEAMKTAQKKLVHAEKSVEMIEQDGEEVDDALEQAAAAIKMAQQKRKKQKTHVAQAQKHVAGASDALTEGMA